ncbi:CAP domain-containing protein [Cupriavidus sp. 2MCAB6]|uniref:CAP domain-containing protein n=1 Tax=Cupriavidus sp. 2MCAB6 TaxID=3232981 RepID=UPI003F931822
MLANHSTMPGKAHFPKTLLVLACATLALSACGGGEGGGSGASAAAPAGAANNAANAGAGAAIAVASTSQAVPATAVTACFTVTGNAAPATSTSAVSVLPVRGAAAVTNYRVLGEPKAAGLCYANFRRVQVGLPALEAQDAIGVAAQNHSNYMLWNKTLGHDENSAARGFTGTSPNVRVQALYPTGATAEVVGGATKWSSDPNAVLTLSSNDALVSDLFDAPLHRATLLGSYKSAGAGYAEEKGTGSGGATASFYQTVDLADATMPGTSTQMVAYPYAGQADVPTNWVNNESPNPAPGYQNQTLGYPITLQAIDRSQTFNADTFVLTDAQGNNINCLKVDARSAGLSGAAAGAAVCTPLAPLAAASKYNVTVSGQLAGKPLNLNWSFTTK